MPNQPSDIEAKPEKPWWRHRACLFWLISPLPLYLLIWPQDSSLAFEVWLALNGILQVAQSLWALRHITSLWNIRGTILRWSLWAPLLIATPIAQAIDEGSDSLPLPTGAAYLILVLLVFPFGALLGVLMGVAGAGNGLLASPSKDRVVNARSGVRWCWIILLPLVAAYVFPEQPLRVVELLCLGLPWISVCLQPFFRAGLGFGVIGRFDLWLARRLRWKFFGRMLDLRAPVFSSAGFLLAWGLIGTKIFALLQASYLTSNIQMMDFIEIPQKKVKSRQIVILDWDSAARRMAMDAGSETSVQIQLLQRLSGLGPSWVVLNDTSERFNSLQQSAGQGSFHEGVPESRPPDGGHLEELESAIRTAGNVLLLTSEATPERLRMAARDSSPSRLPTFRSSTLPLIPFRWEKDQSPPAPIALALHSATSTDPHEARPVISPDGVAMFHGRKFPLIDRKSNLLVVSNFEEEAFPRVSCSEILRGEWQFQSDDSGKGGGWVPPEVFFRDKIVFIPPLESDLQPGPFHPVGSTLLLAHATEALLKDRFLQSIPPGAEIGIALACALLVGAITMRRDPLKAGWRLLLVLCGILFASLALFANSIWLDPFLAMTSSIASFLLVTQLSFSLERAAKNRNRALLHRFVDPLIARELLDSQESRIGLGGQRENVVILFADVRGFSQFAERHAPEEVMRVVNDYLGVMTDVLHSHGGLLDKYTGDGLMAMFRIDRVGSVVGAVQAALAMRNAVLDLSRGLVEEGDKPLGVGISIHVGEAVVGLIGNSEHQVNFTAFGHTVVLASRLQAVADGGEVVVSESVYEAIRDRFQIEPRPTVIVKGISQPVQPYLVLRSLTDDPDLETLV